MNFIKLIILFLFLITLGACYVSSEAKKIDYVKVENKNSYVQEFFGQVRANQSTQLSFQTEGRIVFLPYTKGDFIKKGQVIARLDGTLYAIRKKEEEAKLKEYIVVQEKQKKYYNRLDILHKEGAISDNEWEEGYYSLKTTAQQINLQKEKINYLQKEITYNTIIAPYNGYISDKFVDNGAYAKIGMPVVSYIGSSGLQVEIMASDRFLNEFNLNQVLWVEILNKKYLGTVSNISKSSLNSGGYLIKIRLNKTPNEIKEGMSATVKLPLKASRIMLPIKSIINEGDEKYVYKIKLLKKDKGIIVKQKVAIGELWLMKLKF